MNTPDNLPLRAPIHIFCGIKLMNSAAYDIPCMSLFWGWKWIWTYMKQLLNIVISMKDDRQLTTKATPLYVLCSCCNSVLWAMNGER